MMTDYNLLPRCPLCGEKLRLSYACTSDKAEGHKQKWHYYCRCGLWSPLMDTPEGALSVAQKRWQEQKEVIAVEKNIKIDR